LIFASTSAVYEGLNHDIYSEDMNVKPHLSYPLTKFFSEMLIKAQGETNNLEFVIFRFFNVYGPRQNFHRSNPPLVNYLVKCLATGSTPKLYAPRNQARDYVYVGDLVDLMEKTISPTFIFPNDVYNVCSGVEISIADILEAVSRGYGSDFEIKSGRPEQLWEMHTDLFQGSHPLRLEIVQAETLKHSRGDITKSKLDLGWVARTNVLEQISKDVPQMLEFCAKFTSA
jgi:nucleoside-diphosphate-sugar epimerase